jgi:disulfide bond formation protein DsbB
MTPHFAIKLNALALYSIAAILLGAFYFQITLNELPCPLCLLQRVGFVALAVGPVLTLRFGPRPWHYGLVLIAAMVGAIIAGRHVLLHIMPGDPGYGSVVFGYYFYTWAFVCFAAAMAASAVMLLFDDQFYPTAALPVPGAFEKGAVFLVLAVTLLNAASAFLECGFGFCPADPVVYELLQAQPAP